MFIIRYKPRKSRLFIYIIIFCVALVLVLFYTKTDLLPSGITLLISCAYGVITESIALSKPLESQKIILELNHNEIKKATGFFSRTALWHDIVVVKRWRVVRRWFQSGPTIDRDGWLFVKKYKIFNIFIADNDTGLARMAFVKKLRKYYNGPIELESPWED